MKSTPICDFVEEYVKRDALRLHMPGHKGKKLFGVEEYDITEVNGADVLYLGNGIIKESEENARDLFSAGKTLYSTEGSSLSIRAILYLLKLYAKESGREPKILAARNAHKSFVNASAILDIDVDWIYSKDNVISCKVDLEELEAELVKKEPTAVYITSPDYLGNIADIAEIAKICHKHNSLLLVDNAHGAYLKFLKKTLHPIDLGADICCDSAHKTLSALTGAGYLHISENAPDIFIENAEKAMSIFASTSPSYLIMQSLDRLNAILSDDYDEKLSVVVKAIEGLKSTLLDAGFRLVGSEPLKLTISAKEYGYTGEELSEMLEGENIVCEFADPDFVVMMFSYATSVDELEALKAALCRIEKKKAIEERPPKLSRTKAILKPSEAILSLSERVAVKDARGRVLASAHIACPPAIPIVVSGEMIDEDAIRCFEYYGVKECSVILDK